MSDAIYTLANDKTLDWLFALVGSLQNARCELSINVIPFNKQTTKLKKTINSWRSVQLWEPPELEQLDEIGVKFSDTGNRSGLFRKLATFWCPHETFIYLDADIVVGGNPALWIARYKQAMAEVDIVTNDDDWAYVFRPGRLSEEFMRNKRAAVNSGFWISRQGLISFEDVLRAADSAQQYKNEFMSLEYGEQPFWNYLMWHNKLMVRTFPVLGSEFVTWSWAGTHAVVRGSDLGFKADDEFFKSRGLYCIVPFLHWAGLKAGPEMANWHIYLKAALSAANRPEQLALLYRFFRINPMLFIYKVLKSLLIKTT